MEREKGHGKKRMAKKMLESRIVMQQRACLVITKIKAKDIRKIMNASKDRLWQIPSQKQVYRR